jgi:hypothetical protein
VPDEEGSRRSYAGAAARRQRSKAEHGRKARLPADQPGEEDGFELPLSGWYWQITPLLEEIGKSVTFDAAVGIDRPSLTISIEIAPARDESLPSVPRFGC